MSKTGAKKSSSKTNVVADISDTFSNLSNAQGFTSKAIGTKTVGAGINAGTGVGAGTGIGAGAGMGSGMGWGAAHHAAIAAGGGAGGGFVAGKAGGLKLGLGLGGLGGPIFLAALVGAGSYALYKMLQKPKALKPKARSAKP